MIPTEIPTTVTTQAPTEEPKVSKYDFTSHESNLLCKIAMAEAGNQDTKGKALVMLVVLNRAYGNNEFPDTIEEVIYQPKQFSPVLEGKFESTEPDDDCYKAIELVQSGWDESQGALYFESKSKSTWHEDNLRFLFKHQDHYFYAERG
jgi:N-acetylmuramoyl-L-alanine amidase